MCLIAVSKTSLILSVLEISESLMRCLENDVLNSSFIPQALFDCL
jgi:hypothetical protein